MTHEEILVDYDDLEAADILATLLFAARLSQVKKCLPIGTIKFLVGFWQGLFSNASEY